MWDSIATDSCDVCQCPARTNKRADSSFLDKENIQTALSPVKNEELSFYGNASPTAPICSGTSPNHCSHNIISRRPLEDHDPNSRDSGYLTNYSESGKFSSYASPTRGSFESFCSMEDEFFEDFSDIEPLEDNLPKDFSKLISGPIAFQNKSRENLSRPSPKDTIIRPLFRRALSLQNDTPNSRVRSCLFKTGNIELRPFKRPDPPSLDFESPTNSKKAKLSDDDEDDVRSVPSVPRPLLQRTTSSTEESIMSAVQRSSMEPDLIGDFSKTFCLPLTPGRHQDLKSITSNTLARLIRGDFNGNVASFQVIDCRYPYEYDGGHISGAVNIYTKDQCMELLNKFASTTVDSDKRNILVFHCEFSSERGPNLYRYLRKEDRQLNESSYPSLNFPEIYLLEGGYKHFFEHFANLCVPIAYKEMLHPEHENDLKYFRQKSKTWNADTRHRPYRSLKRLGL